MTKLYMPLKIFLSILSLGLLISNNFPVIASIPTTTIEKESLKNSTEIFVVRRKRSRRRRRSRLKFKVRRIRFARSRRAGISRGNCNSNSEPMKFLLPQSNPQSSKTDNSNISKIIYEATIEKYPTLFVYIPKTSAPQAKFRLSDDRGYPVYEETFNVTKTPALVSLNIPSEEKYSLKLGKKYYWQLSLICDPNYISDNYSSLGGFLERVELKEELANKLSNAEPREHPFIYAESEYEGKGLWLDTLTSLANLIKANPNDSDLQQDWVSLLESVGIDNSIIKAPLLELNTVPKNSP